MLAELAEFAADAVTSAGYLGIFAAMVAETVFPPIPSEIVLPLAGFEVARGNLNFLATVLAATAGSLVGAWILFALGRYGGRPAVLRWRRVLRVGEADLERVERWFDKWGNWVVLLGRMIPLSRSIVSIPAGFTRMPLVRFSLLTALGSLIWNVLLAGAGYQLGSRWEEVTDVVGRYSDVAAALVVAAVAVGIGWFWRWRSKRRAGGSPELPAEVIDPPVAGPTYPPMGEEAPDRQPPGSFD
jgi:membrane protein DedA with SNARE-associated domain